MKAAHPLPVVAFLLMVTLFNQGCSQKEATPDPAPAEKADKAGPKKFEITITPKNPNAPVALGKPDVNLDAAAWYAENKKDFIGSRQKYKNKVVELTGTVSRVSESYNHATISLKAGPGDIDEVRCYTTDPQPWLKVAPGSKVVVKGKVPEAGTVGDLGHVQIVDAGTSAAISVTADQVAKDYLADRKAAVEKFNKKWVYLDGEIIATKETEVTLKGEKDVTVICYFGIGGKNKSIDALKAGTKAKLFGQLGMSEREEERRIGLQDALLTEPRVAETKTADQ